MPTETYQADKTPEPQIGQTLSVVLKKFGSYDSISIEQTKLPYLDGKIEVKVEYGGVNFADIYTRKGLIGEINLPGVLGIECSGRITAIGCDTDFKVGDPVVCYNYLGGMYSQTIRIPPENCFLIPENVSLEDAAAAFVNYLTAYFCIIKQGNLQPFDKVLIMSCTGGVGIAAMQIAKQVKNVCIYGSGSEHKRKKAILYGAAQFIPTDRLVSSDTEIKERFDVILCNQGGAAFSRMQNLLKPMGRIILIGVNEVVFDDKKLSIWSLLNLWWQTKDVSVADLMTNNRTVSAFHLGKLMETDREKVQAALNEIFTFMQRRLYMPKIHRTYPITKVVDAMKALANRKNIGKVLIKMQEEGSDSDTASGIPNQKTRYH